MIYTSRQIAETIVESLEDNSADDVSKSIVKILSDQNELHRMRDVIFEIENVWKDKYGVGTIIIESAEKISAKLKKTLENISKGAEVQEKINKDLIGGAKLRIDDTVINGSIQGHLKQLKRTLQES